MLAVFFTAGCGWLGPAEEIKQQPGKTSFRSADQDSTDTEVAAPATKKVPGE
jgi:hypothetical protein